MTNVKFVNNYLIINHKGIFTQKKYHKQVTSRISRNFYSYVIYGT